MNSPKEELGKGKDTPSRWADRKLLGGGEYQLTGGEGVIAGKREPLVSASLNLLSDQP